MRASNIYRSDCRSCLKSQEISTNKVCATL